MTNSFIYKRVAAALILAGAVLAAGGCGKTVPTAKTDSGYKAASDADYKTAQASFQQALTEGEDAVSAGRGLGIALMGQAKYKEAAQAFTDALAATDGRMPDTVTDLLEYKASAQYRMKDYDGTIASCGSIIELDDKNVSAYYFLGASYLCKGDQDKAKVNFDYAVSLRPKDYELYLNIYASYQENKLSAAGGGYLQTALGITPSAPEDYYRIGQIYYYLGQYDEAKEALIEPVKENYIPAMSLMGQIYLAQGDEDNAKATYTQIQETGGESADSYNGLALCAIQAGDPDTALTYISKGLEMEGSEGKQELYFNEIVAYEKKLDFLTAKDKCQTYVDNYPADEAGQKELLFLNTRG